MLKKVISSAAIFISFGVTAIGTALFLISNRAIIAHFAIFSAATALIILSGAALCIALKKKQFKSKGFIWTAAVLSAVCVIIIAVIIIKYLSNNSFQPIGTQSLAAAFLITGVIMLPLAGLLSLILNDGNVGAIIAPAAAFLLILCFSIWAGTQNWGQYSGAVSSVNYIFKNGEGGYYTFRIPSLIALDKNVLNDKYGQKFSDDILLAAAEGRQNSSLDTGKVDIVYKLSRDGGKSWSKLHTLMSFGKEVGKYGNPTMVFDRETALVNIVYLKASKASGYDYRTFASRWKLNKNYSLEITGKPILLNGKTYANLKSGGDGVNDNTIMPGPGKGLQLSDGRLVIPMSNRGKSYAEFSDDNGLHWQRGNDSGYGNECEIAQTSSGKLVMTVRENKQMGMLTKQFVRLSFSDDNGESWYEKCRNTTLKTPVCMTGTAVSGNLLLVSHPNDFYTRANLSLAVSADEGGTFKEIPVYPYSSGYSCPTTDSGGNIYILAEVGKVNYNEALAFIKIDRKALNS